MTSYDDSYGNLCSRLVAPAGQLRLTADAIVCDSGEFDPFAPEARQLPVKDLLGDSAWERFGNGPEGWARVQAICDFAHEASRSATSTFDRRGRRGSRSTKASASAVTTLTTQSRSAA